MTVQQRKLLKALIAGKTVTDAAKDAGYAFRSAASRAVRTGTFNAAMKYALRSAGLDENALTEKLKELLEAQRPFGPQNEYGPDNPTRLGALDTALKIGGGYAPTKAEISGPEGGPIRTVTPLEPGDLAKAAEAAQQARKGAKPKG